MKPKRILITGPFPPPISGVSLANQVTAAVLNDDPSFTVAVINTSVKGFDEQLGRFSLKKLWTALRTNFMAFKVLGCDVLYLTPGQTFFGILKYAPFILLGSLSRKRIIIHLHGNHLGTHYHSLKGSKKTIFRKIIAKAHTGIVLSESLKDNFRPFLPATNIRVLHNFVLDELLRPLPIDKDFTELRIVYLSNLMLEKGILDLLDALLYLEARGTKLKVRIAGHISKANSGLIHRKISKLKGTEYIGVVDLPAKKELLAWSNVFVLPTYYSMEGQPIALLEAMATANAVVATAHAGIPDILPSSGGITVEPRDPQAIVIALQKLNADKQQVKLMAESNAAHAAREFTMSRYAAGLKDIISDVAK